MRQISEKFMYTVIHLSGKAINDSLGFLASPVQNARLSGISWEYAISYCYSRTHINVSVSGNDLICVKQSLLIPSYYNVP